MNGFADVVEGWLAGLAAGDDDPQRAYRRADAPGLLLTEKQWANWDEMQELFDRMDAKYGWMARNVLNSEGFRRIW